MNIIFVTEQNMIGKVPDDFYNLRTEFVWMKMLGAFHLPYSELINLDTKYKKQIDEADLLMFIPSKSNPRFLEIIFKYRDKKIGIIQEGPNNCWQEWDVYYQKLYLAIVREIATIVFCHNEYDKSYFQSITTKPVIILPTVQEVNKWLKNIKPFKEKEDWVFVGGNCDRWYNGMNSYMVSTHPKIIKITFPSMGRKKKDEEYILKQGDKRVNHIPYLPLSDFLSVLKDYKYAVHLMPEIAAASFSLNCAMLGIPCIGNVYDDTQRKCFPDLSIHINDIGKAAYLLNKLISDKNFYAEVVNKAIEAVKEFDIDFQRDKILNKIEEILSGKYELDKTFRTKDGMSTGTPLFNELEKGLTKKRYSFIFSYDKDIFKGKKVVDCGNGWGLGTKLIADNGASEVVGIDVHPDAIRIAKLEYPDPKITYINDYIKKEMFNKNSVDIFVAVEFIEHLSDANLKEFFSICKYALKKDGLIYITTPKIRGKKEDYPRASHYTEYEPEELKEIMEENGFEQIWYISTDETEDSGFAVLFKLKERSK